MINYNANDIELYLNGKMAAVEMHVFEEAMMNDPMLADAVDGYRFAIDGIDVKKDLFSLSNQLSPTKAASAKVVKGSFKQWMSIAAGLIVLLSTSVVLYRIFYQSTETKTNNIAIVLNKDSAVTEQSVTKVDSTSVTMNDQATVTTLEPVIIPSAKIKKHVYTLTNKSVAKKEAQSIPAPATAMEQIRIENTITSTNKDNTGIKPSAAEIKSTSDKKTETIVLNKFTGRVIDEHNNPLPFANVTERTSGVGTYTDINGNFVILSADSVLTVQTKSVGYGNAVTQIKSSQASKIILKDKTIIANAPSAKVLYNRTKNRSLKQETEADEMEAEPADGWGNYNTYIANNLKKPEQNMRKQPSETKQVELLFDVNTDGTVTNIKVKRSNCNQCNEEAIRILKEGPRWKSKTGKKETTRFTVQF